MEHENDDTEERRRPSRPSPAHNPIERLKRQDEETRRTGPHAGLKERHATAIREMQQDHVRFARSLADDHKIEESEIRSRSANDEFPLGTVQRKRLDEMKLERDRMNANHQRDMSELVARHRKELDDLDQWLAKREKR